MWDKESCTHQETHSFPPASLRGSNPTQTPSPAAFQLLPWLYPTAVEEFLCSAAISPHIPVLPSPTPALVGTGEQGGVPGTPNPQQEHLRNALCRVQVKMLPFPSIINEYFES